MQQCVPITLVLDSGEEEETDAWNSLASQPSRVNELQVHRETLSYREEDPQCPSLASTGICIHAPIHTYKYICRAHTKYYTQIERQRHGQQIYEDKLKHICLEWLLQKRQE